MNTNPDSWSTFWEIQTINILHLLILIHVLLMSLVKLWLHAACNSKRLFHRPISYKAKAKVLTISFRIHKNNTSNAAFIHQHAQCQDISLPESARWRRSAMVACRMTGRRPQLHTYRLSDTLFISPRLQIQGRWIGELGPVTIHITCKYVRWEGRWQGNLHGPFRGYLPVYLRPRFISRLISAYFKYQTFFEISMGKILYVLRKPVFICWLPEGS